MGERIDHPDSPDIQEALDLLILAEGPWNEARLATASPSVVAARKWVQFVRSAMETATLDITSAEESIADGWADLRVKNPQQREGLVRHRLRRAALRLDEARERRAQARAALLLDEDPDGIP